MEKTDKSIIQYRILHVNLSDDRIWIEEPLESFYRKYLGGRGLGLYYLLRELRPKADPMGSENVIVFSSGLLNGVPGPGIPKYSVTTKSPLTGCIGESEAGGFWGPELRFCGFDAVVVKGRSEKPVALIIQDQIAHLEGVTDLWELDTKNFQQKIREKYPKSRVLQIGPAGVHQVRFANITNELSFFNGRNGLGAVMGAKNFRAIVTKASQKSPEMPKPDMVREIARRVASETRNNPLSKNLHELGTAGGIVPLNKMGALPTRNWNRTVFEKADEISGQKLQTDYLIGTHGCFACPIRCKRVVKVDRGTIEVDPAFGGPEYENMAALGSLCEVGDLAIVCKANELCNRFAMDAISTGAVIAFAMECFENGIIGVKEIGYKLAFGDGKNMLRMIEDIAYKRGFGSLLAEGSFRAAERLGEKAKPFCHHVKKQELPMHDPRKKRGLALEFAISPRGADHWAAQQDRDFAEKSSPGVKELGGIGITEPVAPDAMGPAKIRQFYYTHVLCSSYDMLGICNLAAVARNVVTLEDILNMIKAATGWKTTWFEIMKCGERANNMARLFNLREGIGSEADQIPEVATRNINGGPNHGTGAIDAEEMQKALSLFYEMAGWNKDGEPLQGKLEEMGLAEFA